MMAYLASIFAFVLLVRLNGAFIAETKSTWTSRSGLFMANEGAGPSRRELLRNIVVGTAAAALLAPSIVRADVSDGTSLPQGVAQFSRVLRLKNDLKVRADACMTCKDRETDLATVLV